MTMERFYRFAGITFRISGEEGDLYREDGVLADFRSQGPEFDHSVELKIVNLLPPVRGDCVFFSSHQQVFRDGQDQMIYVGDVAQSVDRAYMHILRQGDRTWVQVLRSEVPDRIKPRLVLNALEAEHHIVARGGFLLHSSFICWQNRGILFTAPSGTGKSTQAELWRSLRGAEVLNGDRVALIPGPTGWRACGIPYCGTSGICRNRELEVAAIVCLSQAPVTEITRLTGLRAFRQLWEGVSVNVWDRGDMARCTQAVIDVVGQIPVFHLACTPDESAVISLEKAL